MKKLLLILLIMMCAQPVHAEERFDDKDLLLMEYMALNYVWVMYVCDKPALDMEDPVQKKYNEQEILQFTGWIKRTYGEHWREYLNIYINKYENNEKNAIKQSIEDIKLEQSISLKDNLFCKHFLELDRKTSEMFKK